MRRTINYLFIGISLLLVTSFLATGTLAEKATVWGFFGHRRINRLAVFTLPPQMLGFYKKHIQYITEQAVKPDARRYAVKGEAPRHFLDADVYGDSAVFKLPRYWKDAVAKFSEDTLMEYGIVPWHINAMKYRLTEAMKEKNTQRILQLSAEIGHYIADANVPLHTTENYNGQLTGQYGIHGFWESRLPELFSEEYDFYLDPAAYIEKPQLKAWEAVINAHAALDSVLRFEKELTLRLGEDRKWSFEDKNGRTVKVYSAEFSAAYHRLLNGQVERRMRASIQMVGDFWFTCWVDAGQPDLDALLQLSPEEIELQQKELEALRNDKSVKSREHQEN